MISELHQHILANEIDTLIQRFPLWSYEVIGPHTHINVPATPGLNASTLLRTVNLETVDDFTMTVLEDSSFQIQFTRKGDVYYAISTTPFQQDFDNLTRH